MHYEHKNRTTDADLRFMLRLGALFARPSAAPRLRSSLPHSPFPTAIAATSAAFVIELKLQFQLVNLYQPQRTGNAN